jgi:cation-transporting ATPase 13A2
LWYSDEYEIYATILLISSIFSVSMSMVEGVRNQKRLREYSKFDMKVRVLRGPEYNNWRAFNHASSASNEPFPFRMIDCVDLVPGDIIEIPEDSILPCDLILLNGLIINRIILSLFIFILL